MENNYWELSVKINPQCTDIVCEIINSNFNCEGIVTEEAEFKDLEIVKLVNNVVKAYINTDVLDEKDVQNFFKTKRKEIEDLHIFDDTGSWDVSVKKQEITDWSKKWKEHWKPSKISSKIVICPTWETYIAKEDEIIVNLDPGNAFGTGTHATTQLCIEAMEKYMEKDSIAADIGCGSGILAICAAKEGAKFVNAIDNDDTAVKTAIENAKLNSSQEKIEFQTAKVDTLPYEKYDFVMANILHNVLAQIMPDLKRIMKNSGTIVLSGILNTKKDIVLDALKKNDLKLIEIIEKKEWVAIIARKED